LSEEKTIFVRRASGLVRELGWLEAMSLPICFAVGAGINLFAAQAFGKFPHCDVGMAMIVGGVPIVALAAAMALMTVDMPRTGGMYLFMSRTIHPIVGHLATWGYIWATLMAYGVVCYVSARFWGLGCYLFGIVTGNSKLVAVGSVLSQPKYSLALGLAIAVFWWIIGILGMRFMAKILNVVMIIPLAASLVGVAYMIAGWASGAAAAHWDAVFGQGAWQAVLTVAQRHGWGPTSPQFGMFPSDWGATWSAALVAIWAYAGIEAASAVGGEIKTPSKTMIYGGILAPLLVMILYTVMAYSLAGAYGSFISAYEFVAGLTPGSPGADVTWAEVLEIHPSYPSSPMLASIPLFQAVYSGGAGDVVSTALISFATALWLFNGPPAFMVGASRMIFAGAFDRLLPEAFAAVNERFHSPHWAVTFSALVGIFYTVMNHFGHWVVLVSSEGLMVIAFSLSSLAAIVYPYVRSDIWERGLRLKIGPIPLVTLLGLVAFPMFLYATLIAISGLSRGWQGMAFYVGFYTVFLLVAVAQYAYNLSRGVDIRLIYSEIPPA